MSEHDPKAAASSQGEEDGGAMTFWEHLDELRKRLVYCIIAFIIACLITWEYSDLILNVLSKPFRDAWVAQNLKGEPTLHFESPQAGFIANFRLSMLGAIALAAPVLFYQLWAFVAPGLYAREKRFVIPFVLFSTLLFVGGGFFAWRAAFPITFGYFLSFARTGDAGLAIAPTVMMGEYIDFVTKMILGFGAIFELPLLILFLSVAGIINYLHLIRFGRWFILLAFIIAAVLTPPDMTSQLVMAVPMIVLYGASIGLAFVFGKKPTEAQREAYKQSKKKNAPAT